MSTDSLWGELPNLDTTRTPRRILVEQGAQLAAQTGHLVEAEVTTVEVPWTATGNVAYSFALLVPSLGNYRYDLFVVSHDKISIYPATVYVADDMKGLVSRDESEFKAVLAKVFQSDRTRKALTSLLLQATEVAQGY